MFAMTYSDVGGKTHVLFHNNRALIFNTIDEARKYETDIFVPYLTETIEKGILVSKRWFRPDVYKKVPMAEVRKMMQIGNTLTIRAISDIKYKK